MTCRISSRRRKGFSLVELLAVVGIIALLIAILVPSLNVATRRAKSTATLNTIRVLETAVETFKADMAVGGAYPESAVLTPSRAGPIATFSPHVNQEVKINGASLLVWALAGADLLGTPGFRDLDGSGTWRDDTTCNDASPKPGLYDLAGNQPVQPRSGPFVAVETMKMPQPKDANPNMLGIQPEPGAYVLDRDSLRVLPSPCFLDAFGQPILYYRANPAGTVVAGVKTAVAPASSGLGIYDLYDNFAFTGAVNGNSSFGAQESITEGLELGAGRVHPIAQLGNPLNPKTPPNGPGPRGSFSNMIWDSNVLTLARPQRPDSFILLSPGPDHRYGTADDIGNIKINK